MIDGSNYNPAIHHRRSIRLKGYDYSQKGLYFITLCTENGDYLFGEIINGKMILNEYGKIIEEEWLKTIEIRENIALGEFIIMPNHFHSIIEIKYQIPGKNNEDGGLRSPSNNIGAIIRGFKGATTKRINILKNPNIPEESQNSNSTGVSRYARGKKELGGGLGGRLGGELQFAPTAPTATAPTKKKIAATKKGIAKTKTRTSIWQRNYYEIIIRNEIAHYRISEYIKNNPAKWQTDKFH